MLQHVIVALIVLGAGLYASWTLLPAALRRPLARRLLRVAPNAGWLRKAARSAGGCGGGDGCCGCSSDPAQAKPVTLHRLPRH
ncbi:hypothetical protein KGA65_17205 [Ideonella sp. B7]|uniref:DUF6587 family protein n=1 Tax=Ideonella benzenivorans TaxID=2831643 RepID=UPI001CEC7D4D|nr:hypothetical protein [Ideonella benzenivorans]MCA6218275.1 hypothetical protein [Ideonella benzenivorans]